MAYNYEFPYTDPNFYNDDWLLKKMKALLADLDALDDWKAAHEQEYQQLKDLYDAVMAGNFPPSVIQGFSTWMKQNGLELVGQLVKMVFFGITDDGYFVAYIPEYWDDIIFNTTGYDLQLAGYDFGHLTLSFETGGI